MSSFLTREYKFNNNSLFDSSANSKKEQLTMAVSNLKKLLKPIMHLVKKKRNLWHKTLAEIQQNALNASLEDMRKDPVAINASVDNYANECLEQQLYHEIRHCPANAAVIIQQGQQQVVLPVNAQQNYIPVHFARTNNGTFFWTSIDTVRHHEWQLRAHFDRWAQA